MSDTPSPDKSSSRNPISAKPRFQTSHTAEAHTVETYTVGNSATRVVISPLSAADLLAQHRERLHGSLLVADENTIELCGSAAVPRVVLPPGESAKQWSSVSRIIETALESGIGRDGRIIGVGGGVICDIAAFAASIYLRGVAITLVPTTLLAMVDAAFGGKTGINFGGYKNMVGTFYPAADLLVAPSAVASLPEREYHSGLAEAIKSAMLGDTELFSLFEREPEAVLQRESATVRAMVERSLAIKASVVERDFTERGIRAWLNLGHTFAHALESVAGLGLWSHGEAVAWGMACALDLGVDLGITDRAYAARATALLERYGFRLRADGVGVDDLLQAMQYDKKVQSGAVRFVLQRDLGLTEVVTAPPDAVQAVLAKHT